jgi:protein tyrosine phosphatase (PTP) superfamily phosphohydrolase (DUF442 family)
MLNTIKSVLRFQKSFIVNIYPLKSKDNSLEDIVNYIKYNDMLSSSGQPTNHHLSIIQKAGYDAIIDLVPSGIIELPLKDEEAIVTKLGMEYVHIPVDPFNPSLQHFDTFVNTMQNASGKKTWVHCAVNMCTPAFIHKYRCAVLGETEQDIIWDLRKIWKTFGA